MKYIEKTLLDHTHFACLVLCESYSYFETPENSERQLFERICR